MNAVLSPLKTNLFISTPLTPSTIRLRTTSPHVTRGAMLLKNTVVMKLNTTILALHGTRGTSNRVNNLARLDSMILVPITAGTLHPKPRNKGMKDFPCSPMRCMNLSIAKAPRAMYPTSSSNPMEKKKTKSIGAKVITNPAPPMIPSTTKLTSHPGIPELWADIQSVGISTM